MKNDQTTLRKCFMCEKPAEMARFQRYCSPYCRNRATEMYEQGPKQADRYSISNNE